MHDIPSMRLSDTDLEWHDGNLVDLHLEGMLGPACALTLAVDLAGGGRRRRYRCVGRDLKRIVVTGDIERLVKNGKSGNIDMMRLDFGPDTEILFVSMFGGSIEAEASYFELTEAQQ